MIAGRIRAHHRTHGCEAALELAIEEIARLTRLIDLLHPEAAAAAVTVSNLERNPTTMAFDLRDDDTSRHAEISYFKADGSPAAVPAGATVVFAAADPAVVTVDASSGAIGPAADGDTTVGATVTLADGTVLNATPADVHVEPAPPAAATVTIV